MKKYIALTAIVAGLISGFAVLEYQQYRESREARAQEQAAQAMIGAPYVPDATDIPTDTSNLPGTR